MGVYGLNWVSGSFQDSAGYSGEESEELPVGEESVEPVVHAAVSFMGVPPARGFLPASKGFLGYRTFGVSFGAVFCCVGAVVRVLKLGWPGFMGGQKVCLGSGFFVVVPRDKSV